jgi:ketosteroid isomerase-like protein
MRKFVALSFILTLLSWTFTFAHSHDNIAPIPSTSKDSLQIVQLLDSFNVAAANAEFDKYFSFFTEDAIFIGTDATERWDKVGFMKWAKPFFTKKTTWNFKALERHIYLDKAGKIAWFDELLNTQMKICRGSGVLVKIGNQWKIKQYVLSMTIPNAQIDSIVPLKAPIENTLIDAYLNKK